MNWIDITWPIGHFLLLWCGYKRFTLRRRRHWWTAPWYERGEGLMPYRVALRYLK
jgi:hypothetical protein